MLQNYTLTGNRVIRGQADFLRYDNDIQVALRVRADGQDMGLLWPGESLELPAPVDLWEIKGATDGVEATGTLRIGTGRIRTDSRAQMLRPPVLLMETGVGQVAAGYGPGWVSGDPASLAANSSVLLVFDLGEEWTQYGELQILGSQVGPSSSVTYMLRGSNSAAPVGVTRALRDLQSTGVTPVSAAISSGQAVGVFRVRPVGRYLIVQFINNDAAAATSPTAKVVLTAYPS